jgi:putative nucleotidyltransferase with HDIG domain
VAFCARRLAEQVGVSGADLEIIEQGALLHDIGKIGVRDSILLKPGPLTPEEWVEMRMHPEIGYRMLAKMPYLKDASLIVYEHQERWDGRGFPRGLKGEEIVLGARIFSIVDAMDAITSDRPYREGRTLAVAKEEIKRCIGTQFDPQLVAAWLSISDDDWAAIRRRVESLEAEEVKRWEAQGMLPSPKKAIAAANARS